MTIAIAYPAFHQWMISWKHVWTKFKGVTLNSTNRWFVNLTSIKEIIFEGKEIRLPPYDLFVRDKINGAFFNRRMRKTVELVYTKRILPDNFDTIPYGYVVWMCSNLKNCSKKCLYYIVSNNMQKFVLQQIICSPLDTACNAVRCTATQLRRASCKAGSFRWKWVMGVTGYHLRGDSRFHCDFVSLTIRHREGHKATGNGLFQRRGWPSHDFSRCDSSFLTSGRTGVTDAWRRPRGGVKIDG